VGGGRQAYLRSRRISSVKLIIGRDEISGEIVGWKGKEHRGVAGERSTRSELIQLSFSCTPSYSKQALRPVPFKAINYPASVCKMSTRSEHGGRTSRTLPLTRGGNRLLTDACPICFLTDACTRVGPSEGHVASVNGINLRRGWERNPGRGYSTL